MWKPNLQESKRRRGVPKPPSKRRPDASWKATVDGKNLATPGALGGVPGSPGLPLGPPGGWESEFLRKKKSACKIWCRMVGVIEVSGPFLVQRGWVGQHGYAYFFGFKSFSIKSAFEPITHPLKWVLADAACKVNVIYLNIASIQAGKCKTVQKHIIFEDFGFRDFM